MYVSFLMIFFLYICINLGRRGNDYERRVLVVVFLGVVNLFTVKLLARQVLLRGLHFCLVSSIGEVNNLLLVLNQFGHCIVVVCLCVSQGLGENLFAQVPARSLQSRAEQIIGLHNFHHSNLWSLII